MVGGCLESYTTGVLYETTLIHVIRLQATTDVVANDLNQAHSGELGI